MKNNISKYFIYFISLIFTFPKKHFYNVEGVEMSHTPVDFGIPLGYWRSPPNNINVFYL